VVGATIVKMIDDRPTFLGFATDSITLEQRASVTRFAGHVDLSSELLHVSNGMTDARVGGRVTLHGPRLTQTLGYELSRQRASFHSTSALAEDVGDLIPFDSIDARSSAAGVYVDELWRPRTNLFVEAGLRFDDVQPANWTKLLPRASVKYLIGPSTAITAGVGTYAQWVHSLGREEEPIRPLQFWVTSNATAPVSRATDVTLGLEHWVSPSRLFHIEGFTKRYIDLLVPNPASDPRVAGDEFFRATGTSYGVDLLIRQFETRVSRFGGWVSYSYGFNTRLRADGTRYYPIQDRRHNLNLVGSWRVDHYTWGTRVNLGSDIPSTPVLGQYLRYWFDPATGRWVPPRQGSYEQNIPAALNSARVPYYLRADASVKRTGRLFGLEMSPYLSVVNVLNVHNPAAYLYTFDSYDGNRATFPNLPFVPTFGVSIVY